MQHLSTETYNIEQVSKVFIQNSAETCLEIDYFPCKFPKSPTAGGSTFRLPFRFNNYRMCKEPTPIEQFWLKQMLGILGQNETYILCFLALSPLLSKNRSHTIEGADIYRRYTNKFNI